MAFSDAFARGYAVGDSIRKKRATSKFFEKFKELTAEDEEEMVAEDGSAIPLDSPAGEEVAAAIPAATAKPGEAATPAPPVEGAAADTPAPAAPAAPAIPVAPTEKPAAAPQEAAPQEAAIPVSPTPEKAAAPAGAEKKKQKASLDQNDIKDLDRLAMEAARASGDVQVYTALQQTTNSFLQGKVLSNLGLAQTAAQNGDVDATEKYLKKAYRFVPDGHEVKFERKDGKLWVNDPWSDEGKKIPLGSEQIGYIGTMLTNPEKWSDIMREGRKERFGQKMEERRVAAIEKGTDIDQQRVDVAKKQLGISEQELALKGREVKLKEVMAPIERLETYQRALYYSALGDAARAGAKAGKDLSLTLDDAREAGAEIDKQFKAYIAPETNPLTGEVREDWKPPVDVADMAPKDIQTANGLAQAIGAQNLGAVSPGMAVQAGLALVRAQSGLPDSEIEIMADKGIMLFNYNGVPTPVKLPAAVIQGLVAQQAAQQRPAAGLPPAIPVNPNPTAPPPARAW